MYLKLEEFHSRCTDKLLQIGIIWTVPQNDNLLPGLFVLFSVREQAIFFFLDIYWCLQVFKNAMTCAFHNFYLIVLLTSSFVGIANFSSTSRYPCCFVVTLVFFIIYFPILKISLSQFPSSYGSFFRNKGVWILIFKILNCWVVYLPLYSMLLTWKGFKEQHFWGSKSAILVPSLLSKIVANLPQFFYILTWVQPQILYLLIYLLFMVLLKLLCPGTGSASRWSVSKHEVQ